VDATKRSVWLSRSVDGGLTWRLAARVADAASPQSSSEPMGIALAVGPEPARPGIFRVHVAYAQTHYWDAAGNLVPPAISYAHATLDPAAAAGGLGFTAPVAISMAGGFLPRDYGVVAVADTAGGVHVAANDSSAAVIQVVYWYSADHGDVFDTGTVIAAGGSNPALGVAPTGDVFLAWQAWSPGVWIAHRSPGAASFDAAARVGGEGSNPELSVAAADARRVYVAWASDTYSVARSSDGGLTWQVVQGPLGGQAGAAFAPSVAASTTGTVGVAWGGHGTASYARSTDGGVTFTAPAQVGSDPGTDFTVALVLDDAGKANLAFCDGNPLPVVWFAKEQ
jgi:hypothetical protein